jgi:hypothetical protein
MKFLHTTLIIVTIGLFTSCTVLTPSGPNVPLFREKGEKMVNANFIAGEETLGAEVKGAIATGNHFYLGGNLTVVSFGAGARPSLPGEEGRGTGYMTELGAGGFGKIGTDGIFDMSGGIGFGSSFSDQLMKIYLQPAIGFRRKKVEFATGIKATYLNSKSDRWEEGKSNNFILEPFLLGRFGGEKTKFQAGINFPTVVATDALSGTVPNLTLGVIFRFGKAK